MASMLLDDALRQTVRARLSAFEVRRVPHGTHHAAAVAVVITDEGEGAEVDGLARPMGWSGEAALVLTKRAAGLTRHGGQWALPGGRLDAGEDAMTAALRELQEEVGLQLTPDDVLGTLDDYVTRSGFVITPVVAWAGHVNALTPNAEEVAAVHRIRIREFMREDAPLLDPPDLPGRPILRMPVGHSWIAAPTAAVLYQFRELCIAGRATRVAHFDQPEFARR